jgi:hypothetical protein
VVLIATCRREQYFQSMSPHVPSSQPWFDFLAQTLGFLKVLCEVVKSGSAEQVQAEHEQLLLLSRNIRDSPSLSNNTVVRKFESKLISRIGLRLLPGSSGNSRRHGLPFSFTIQKLS